MSTHLITFNSPWGIRFPWTYKVKLYDVTNHLSIPLGELDFLGLNHRNQKRRSKNTFNSPWGIRFPWTESKAGQRKATLQLSIPLGELDFLGREPVEFAAESAISFNSPWGIRFPWTEGTTPEGVLQETSFNSPWGIRFPWTCGPFLSS